MIRSAEDPDRGSVIALDAHVAARANPVGDAAKHGIGEWSVPARDLFAVRRFRRRMWIQNEA
jgi:hypothetical protein